MKSQNKHLTQEELISKFHYCMISGVWRKRGKGDMSEWKEVGWVDGAGYIAITISRAAYPSHRLAWLYVTGEWPKEYLDHIDRDRRNNKFSNLREVTRCQNMQNSYSDRGRDLPRGVRLSKCGRRYRALIQYNKTKKCLGHFECAEDAKEFYELARDMVHGEFKCTTQAKGAQA